jgi:SAM-dependent methyltransferase
MSESISEAGSDSTSVSGLDARFLAFLGNNPDRHRYVHGHYLQYFAGCKRVVDLACGQGHFVRALSDAGVSAYGVDSDPGCVAEARNQGQEVIEEDVFSYLRDASAGSVDGIFCAHLVEHLRFEDVLALVTGSFDLLADGGTMVIVTPNCQSLSTHLDSFYLHFGHESFYHPRLLCFFLQQAGFENAQAGENPRLAYPLWGSRYSNPPAPRLDASALQYERVIPSPRLGARRVIWRAKRFATRLIVQPYVDQLVQHVNEQLTDLDSAHHVTRELIMSLDRSVEAYAVATKGLRSAG